MPTFRKLSASDMGEFSSSSSAASTLTESEIAEWIGSSKTMSRAREYANLHTMILPTRTGQTIKAFCQGTMPQPYRVEVTLGPTGIVEGQCSCPVGWRCKHIAALLLVWQRHPKAFTEVESMDSALARRSQAELIALIRQMVARYPDLETLLELPMPGSTSSKPVDPESIRRQVRSAIHGAGDEWGSSYALAAALEQIVGLGDEYAGAEQWQNAATVYRVVAEETLSSYEMLYDDEGEVLAPVNSCVEGLNHCLDHIQEEVAREGILRALFNIFSWDVDSGGLGVSDEVPGDIAAHVTDEERARVIGWIQEVLPKAQREGYGRWREQAYGGFLLDLQIATLDDESFLRICRETGRTEDLVERLLQLGRIEEAEKEVRQARGYQLLHFADQFVAHGQETLAEQLVHERMQQGPSSEVGVWLKERAKARGDREGALSLAEQLFWLHPTVQSYEELKALATPLGRWTTMRPELFSRLTEKKEYGLLTELHLVEQEVERALETVKQARGAYGHWGGNPLSIRVARAAEVSHPHQAIQLYLDQVTSLINARSRGNYAIAASYLVRVREIYAKQLNDSASWSALISNLREQHRKLRALKDELNQAGL